VEDYLNFFAAVLASVVISAISLIGIITLFLNDKTLKSLLLLFVGLSAGALIGGAFLHILPEALNKTQNAGTIFAYVIAGFTFFFLIEHGMHWRHCHNAQCEVHSFAYMNLVGDAIHNFIDGIIMGVSFAVSIQFGIATSIAILMHEIPQEIGDFGVLVYGGFSKKKALLLNFMTAVVCVLGTIMGFIFTDKIVWLPGVVLPVAAGGFIYIAACDLIPEIHRQPDIRKAVVSIVMFLVGVGLMYALV
jgi:zinc and cadmium transporter